MNKSQITVVLLIFVFLFAMFPNEPCAQHPANPGQSAGGNVTAGTVSKSAGHTVQQKKDDPPAADNKYAQDKLFETLAKDLANQTTNITKSQ